MDCARLRAFVLPPVLLAAFLGLASHAAGAQSPPPVPRAPGADPALDAARAAFEALPEADRRAIQDALVWTGDYSGVADGAFGRQTFAAMASFQARIRQPPSGILTPQARATLLAAAQQARNAAGFTLIDDPKTGIRIGVPTRSLTRQDVNPSGGTRWQSPDGTVTLDTRTAPPDATLQSLYDRNLAIQTPGRVVSYKVLRPDFFVVAGETASGRFYTRYGSGPTGLRGFSIGYDKAAAPQVDRLVVAIANSFAPFPAPAAAVAAVPNPVPAPPGPQPQIQAPAPRLIATGLAVGRRQVVTDGSVRTCPSVSVAGAKPRTITGQAAVVLEFAEDVKARPLTPTRGIAGDGSPVLVVAFADEGGSPTLSAIPGSAAGPNGLTAPLQPGASGAPVLDMTGALIGLVGGISSDQRKVAGIVPSTSHPVVAVSDAANGIPALAGLREQPAAPRRGAADLVDAIRAALVPIWCLPQ
jgi:peptidoglycan hydrolase-like protein with peptidoglycan-binding domain